MNIRIVLVLGCLLALGCDDHQLETNFFNQPLADRVERLRKYPLVDQYKIFRYGNDMREPPFMDLADPIAEKGPAAIPFLMDQLKSHSDDMTIRDILLIFETMATSKSYDVKSDSAVMGVLTSKVASMKSEAWRDNCLKMVQRIKDSG